MIKSFLFDLFGIVTYELNTLEKEIYDYFLEIALKSEYGYSPNRTTKWTKPMIVFISQKEKHKSQVSIIQQTIDKINSLATDGFKIELTNSIHRSNTILYLANRERINELRKIYFKDFNEDFSGLADIEYDSANFSITKARIFIDTDENLEVQKAVILEEITQSIGLMNDSEIYSDSTFFQNKNLPDKKYHNHFEVDKELIRILYSPFVKPGLDSYKVLRAFKRYYGANKK